MSNSENERDSTLNTFEFCVAIFTIGFLIYFTRLMPFMKANFYTTSSLN